MIKPGPLPQPGKQYAVDDDVGIEEWVELEIIEAKAAHNVLYSEFGSEDPLPCQAGDDEGQGVRIEEDGAECVFEPDLLIHQRSQHKPDHKGEYQRADPVDGEVLYRDEPPVRGPEPFILVQSNQPVAWQQFRCSKGVIHSP